MSATIPSFCAACKAKTPHVYEHLEDYIEIRCQPCGQPAKRITYEKAWNRVMAALKDIDPEMGESQES